MFSVIMCLECKRVCASQRMRRRSITSLPIYHNRSHMCEGERMACNRNYCHLLNYNFLLQCFENWIWVKLMEGRWWKLTFLQICMRTGGVHDKKKTLIFFSFFITYFMLEKKERKSNPFQIFSLPMYILWNFFFSLCFSFFLLRHLVLKEFI